MSFLFLREMAWQTMNCLHMTLEIYRLFNMKQKIQTLLAQLNHGLVEREDTLKIALLTVLAGENLVLIGPPGTGKSLVARRIADSFSRHGSIDKNGYFEYLLTKFSTPEEIFGPLSITELKADRFKRNTAGYLPAVNLAFLDEIFKASSSILNALLTILNERIYHNGSEAQKVPLQALIAASNELPGDQEELSALYDRFLVRGFVDYVSQDNLPRLFEKTGDLHKLSQLTAADLKAIERSAESVTLPPEIKQAMLRIWMQHKETFKEDRRESLSDRRLKKVLKLLCVSAATNGRSEVDLSDVVLLKDCLWNHQENAIKVRDLILKTLQSFSRPVPQSHAMQPSAISSELLTYEVGQDGKTLVQAQPQTAGWEAWSALSPVNAKLGVAVKGFRGNGTAQDPLLIQTVEDLMDLSRPDVGLQGYYFRQTADIDCTALSYWADVPFKGHYDGGGNIIKYKEKKSQQQQQYQQQPFGINNSHHSLFISVESQSSIRNLKLESLWLTSTVEDSHITHCSATDALIKGKAYNSTITLCKSGGSLICGGAIGCTIESCETSGSLIYEVSTDCTITSCASGDSLIYGNANSCKITACKSNSFLIRDNCINCTIIDCLVTINYVGSQGEYRGGIAYTLTNSSSIKRCFVTGKCQYKGSGYFNFYGITLSLDSSSAIHQCALGKLEKSSSDVKVFRIVQGVNNGSFLENNVSIDSNPGTDEINGKDGKTIATVLFKKRYFEHTLGWDFDTVWQWDDMEDRPALRSVGINAISQTSKPSTLKASMTDLLTQQMRANIWL